MLSLLLSPDPFLRITNIPVGQWIALTPEEEAQNAAEEALFANYNPEEDPDCKDLQYEVCKEVSRGDGLEFNKHLRKCTHLTMTVIHDVSIISNEKVWII